MIEIEVPTITYLIIYFSSVDDKLKVKITDNALSRDRSELIDELCDSTSKVFTKYKNDSFSSNEFEAYLQEKHIQSLTIVGADISACISATSLGAIHRGYTITLLTDSIFAVNTKVFQNTLTKLSSKGIQLKSSLSNN